MKLRLVRITLVLCLALAGESLCKQTAAGPAVEAGSADDSEELDALYRELARAQTPTAAQKLKDRIWQLWTQGPDERAGEQIEEILRSRQRRDLSRALDIADELTRRLPSYAEGWNQKATVLFEMGRLDQSLQTIEKVLELEPKHFGALAGKAIILLRQGRVKLGQKALRRAVEIHPYLAERRFLVEPPGNRI
jgi:tetratricopeptide (TPR) repeat protein